MTNEQNNIKVWKYIWQKPNVGKNINSELNKKTNYFCVYVKNCVRGNYDFRS